MTALARLDQTQQDDQAEAEVAERTPLEVPEPVRRKRSAAGERAYARRAQRTGQPQVRTRTREREQPQDLDQPDEHPRERVREHSHERPARRRQPVSRPQTSTATFVVLVIGLLLVGVAATLWLSTQAIADSYRLERAKQGAADLAEQAEQLRREVNGMDSASELAKRAQELGMVPAGDPAYLVVGKDGKVRVVGDPAPATAPTPPPSATSTPPSTSAKPTPGTGTTHGNG